MTQAVATPHDRLEHLVEGYRQGQPQNGAATSRQASPQASSQASRNPSRPVTPQSNQNQRNTSYTRGSSQGSQPDFEGPLIDTTRQQAAAPLPRPGNANVYASSSSPRNELTSNTRAGFVIKIDLPEIRPSEMNLTGTQEFPLVTAGVQWRVTLLGRFQDFDSLNAALACLENQIRMRSTGPIAIMESFEDLRRQYTQRVKMQKEYGGSLLFEFAEKTLLRKQYAKDDALFEGTKQFWSEAKTDRNKVTRHIDGLRRLVQEKWICREFMEGYVMKGMNTEVVETNVYEQHLARARQWGLTAREVMQRAEQRRMRRIYEHPDTPSVDITTRDVNLAVDDLVEDGNIVNKPEEKITNAALRNLTELVKKATPNRVPPAMPLWGYVDERRQIFVPPRREQSQTGEAIRIRLPQADEIKRLCDHYDRQTQFESNNLAFAKPPQKIRPAAAKNIDKEGYGKDGRPRPKRKGAGGRKEPAKKANKNTKKSAVAEHTTSSPNLTAQSEGSGNGDDGGEDGEDEDSGDEDEDENGIRVGESPPAAFYTGPRGEEGPFSKRVKLKPNEIWENDLSYLMGDLSLRVVQSKRKLDQRVRQYVTPDQVLIPAASVKSPLKVALFNRAVNDALEYSGLSGKTPMSGEDIQAFVNGFKDLAYLADQARDLFDELNASEMTNELVLVILGQIYSIVRVVHQNTRLNSWVHRATRYYMSLFENTYHPTAHIRLRPGATPADGHPALTLADVRSLLEDEPERGWVTDQLITSVLLTSTSHLFVPSIAATHAWTMGEGDMPVDPAALFHGRVALVFNMENHWVTGTINTNTREWNILDSAEYMDSDRSRRRRIVRFMDEYMRAQFPLWFQPGNRQPQPGNAESQQQSNGNDCGIYVIENLLAFDEGEESASEVFVQAVRYRLIERLAVLAEFANPDIRQQRPRDRPTPPDGNKIELAVVLRPAKARYEEIPEAEKITSPATRTLEMVSEMKDIILKRNRRQISEGGQVQPEWVHIRKSMSEPFPSWHRSQAGSQREQSISPLSSLTSRTPTDPLGRSQANSEHGSQMGSPTRGHSGAPSSHDSLFSGPSQIGRAPPIMNPSAFAPAPGYGAIQPLIAAAQAGREVLKKNEEEAARKKKAEADEATKKSVQEIAKRMDRKK